jgi:hypothetical protein
MVWIFDYTALKLGDNSYPLEISFLNMICPEHCNIFHIKYPCNYFNNFTAKTYCYDHNITWQEDDETIYSAMYKITKELVPNNKVQIIVDSEEKRRFLKPWFSNVLIFGNQMPRLHKYYQDAPQCSRHAAASTNLQISSDCSKKRCIQLMLCYNDAVMYTNNASSLIIYNSYKV